MPHICQLYVEPRVSSSVSVTMARKELAQIHAELDEINAMVRLEADDKAEADGKAEVDVQTQEQQRNADVLLQAAREEVEIIRGKCDDLIEQHKKAIQEHEIQAQQFREQSDQLDRLLRGETEEKEV